MRDDRSSYGMPHISWVRVVVDGASARAEVHGIGHRLPRTAAVPLSAAAGLAARGVPLLISHIDDQTRSPAAGR